MKVKLIALTKVVDEDLIKELKSDSSEELIMYCARVSNPNNQTSGNPKLLDYCIKSQHWSIFEQSSMTLEIETSRAISAQILRHKSFCFQEFSLRYAPAVGREVVEARFQDPKNRQNSTPDENGEQEYWFKGAQDTVWETSKRLYDEGLRRGIAKEQMRFLLPLATTTKMYMHGNLRSWITYIQLREKNGTQKEHMLIALEAKKIFVEQFPVISKALGWVE